MERIIDSQGKRFISEFLTDLPADTMLNKVLTGCGGTTVALSNDVPYVICVPYRAMITNKLKWAAEKGRDICPVMGGVTDQKIASYKGNKYIVTYDSLHRLNEFINPKDFKILIDESHKLIDSASFRNDAVDVVLENYKRYGSFVFMTATPVKRKHQIRELEYIDQAKIQWYGIEGVNVNLIVPKRPLNEELAVISARHLTGVIPGNAHIFINSVNSIVDILKLIDPRIVSPELINIVCATTEKNGEKIMTAMGKQWAIKNVGDVAKVNFYTSTAFEGSDIYDKEGKTYVVTDGKKDYTKNDILTTLPQIIGRIRDTKYKNNIDLIYTSSPYYGNGITEEQYETIVNAELENAVEYVNLYKNTKLPDGRKALYEAKEDDKFIKQHTDGELTVNFTAAAYEMHSFEALHTTYFAFSKDANHTSTALVNDVPYMYTNATPTEVSIADMVLLKKKENFQSTLKFLIDNLADASLTASIRVMHPEMMDYITLLGAEKIIALNYRKKDVKAEYIKSSTTISNSAKVVKMLNYHTNEFISSADIKMRLSYIYKELGIKRSAMATDLAHWYLITPCTKRNRRTGIVERGYEIAMCRFNRLSDDDIREKNVMGSLVDTFTVDANFTLE